jgi:NAD+ kinase
MFKSIGLFLKNPAPSEITKQVCDLLSQHNFDLSIIDAAHQKPFSGLPLKKIDEVDLVLSFGGDGTILQLSKILGSLKTPLLGINQGKVGFLTSIAERDCIKELEKILIQKKYQNQERVRIECLFQGKTYHALNDIVIKASRIARMGSFTISHKTGESFDFPADGFIVSTATGSTGYNLAAGGPILPYKSDLVVMTPICPYKYHVQSIILPRSEETYIDISHDHSPYGITIDGQEFIEFDEIQEKIIIKASSKKLNIIYPEDYNFYGLIQSKLNFGGTFAK